MKKFFKRLNQFLYLKEYEQLIQEKIRKKDHELKYAQDLLLSNKGFGDKLYSAGEINAYINHVEQLRKEEKEEQKSLIESFKNHKWEFSK